MELKKYIGEKIKLYRTSRGMNQERLAELLDTTKQTVSRYEKGQRGTDQDLLFKLSSIFNVSVDDFFPHVSTEYENVSEEKYNYDVIKLNKYTYLPTSISAGLPLNLDGVTDVETISIPDSIMGKYAGHKDIIISKINGDSMDKLMNDGSFIAIKPVDSAESLNNGDIVVFSHNHEYSVKCFYKHDDTLVFKPYSNNPVHYDQSFSVHDGVVIHGKVVTYIVNLD